MKNAEAFWGTAHGTDATCITTASTGTETCNGNGDGKMLYSARSGETFRMWQHLANAGLISGTYAGISDADHATTDAEIGFNIPTSKLSGAGWQVHRHNTGESYGGDTLSFTGSFGNFFFFGGNSAVNVPFESILTPSEAWNLDKKIDDGKPAQGRVWAYRWTTCTDAANNADTTSDYDLSDDAVGCVLNFIKAI